MGELIIANQRFNIDANIKNWHETGWDATHWVAADLRSALSVRLAQGDACRLR